MMGSIIPDVEVPILFLSGLEMQTGHGALHSILGALTVDVLLTVLAVILVYPTLAGLWEGRFGSRWLHFAGVDVGNIEKLPVAAYSGFTGILMHISLDYLTHTTMPYAWPFRLPIETMPIGRESWWLVVVNATLLVLMIWLLARYPGRVGRLKVGNAG